MWKSVGKSEEKCRKKVRKSRNAEKKKAYTTESKSLENFSGLKEKLSRAVVDTKTL